MSPNMFPMPLTPELDPDGCARAGEELFNMFQQLPDGPVDITLALNVLDTLPRKITCVPLDQMERDVLGDKHRLTIMVYDLAGDTLQASRIVSVEPLSESPDWNGVDAMAALVEQSINQIASASSEVMLGCFHAIGWDVSTFMARAEQAQVSNRVVTLVLLARMAQFEMLKIIALTEQAGADTERIGSMMETWWAVDAINTEQTERLFNDPTGTLVMSTFEDEMRRAAGEWN